MDKKRNRFSGILVLRVFAVMLGAVLAMSSCSDSGEENIVSSSVKSARVNVGSPSVGVGRYSDGESGDIPKRVDGKYIICVDPGHGFVDGGCGDGVWADGTLEKDINLSIANKLSEDLEKLGFTVIMTHDGTLGSIKSKDSDGNQIFNTSERVAYANSIDIDYFISIHVNSYDEDPSASGIRIYYEDESNVNKTGKGSDEIAEYISSAIEEEMNPTPSPMTCSQEIASYAVVRETKAAASLIETGFCTNASDAEKLIDDEWQSSLAGAIADGLYSYYSTLN